MIDIKQALLQGHQSLRSKSPTALLDAEVLLAHALSSRRAFLYTYPEKQLTSKQEETYVQTIQKRIAGMPIAYLTGEKEFWSLSLKVTKDTLIPRKETELLVETTLSLISHIPKATLLDLGTGSGAIALALATERPDGHIDASDISQPALNVAKENAFNLKLSNIEFLCSDWFTSIAKHEFHAIVSNPPYIDCTDPHLFEGDVRFEPKEALISGKHGLNSLALIIEKSHERLRPGGLLLLEHGYTQREAVTQMLKKRGYEQISTWQDLQGLDRVSGGFRAA